MTPEFFKNNRKRLFDKTVAEVVILTANTLMQRSNDVAFPFRQDSNFLYLTGVSDSDIIMVMSHDEEFFVLPKLSAYEKVFDVQSDNETLTTASGIKNIHDNKVGWEKINQLIKANKTIGIDMPEKFSHIKIVENGSKPALSRKIKRLARDNKNVVDVSKDLASMRQIKQPQEIEKIQKAIDVTAKAFLEHLQTPVIKNYQNEKEIEKNFSKTFIDNDAVHAYEPIVASGANGCILHYGKNNEPIKKNEGILVDIGAEFDGYAADITRTVFPSGETKRHKEVRLAVAHIQEQALKILKPGITLRQYEQQLSKVWLKSLSSLGLIKYHGKDKIDQKQARKYYPHGTSHFLGLDVHDVGDYEAPLKAGMVITVEPGIYIPEEKIAVRIEDDVLITQNGVKNLSASLPTMLQ